MSHFLIVYRRVTGTLLELREFATDEGDAARAARTDHEQRVKEDPDVEVVLLGAPSREALMRTHSRYFKTVGELAKALADSLPK